MTTLCANCSVMEAQYLGFLTKYPYCSISCYDQFMNDNKRVELWEDRLIWVQNKLRKMLTPSNYIDFYANIHYIDAPTDYYTRRLRAIGLKEADKTLAFTSYWDLRNYESAMRGKRVYGNTEKMRARGRKSVELSNYLRHEYATYVSIYLYHKVDIEIIDLVKGLMVNCMSRSFHLLLSRHVPLPIDPDLMTMVYRETKSALDYMLGFTEGRTLSGKYALSDPTQFPSPKLII